MTTRGRSQQVLSWETSEIGRGGGCGWHEDQSEGWGAAWETKI